MHEICLSPLCPEHIRFANIFVDEGGQVVLQLLILGVLSPVTTCLSFCLLPLPCTVPFAYKQPSARAAML